MLTKNEITALNLSPTKKDFVQIWNELLEVAGRLSERCPQVGEDGEKGRFGLTAGSGGGEQEVVVREEQRPRRRHLHPSQGFPAVGEDVLADEFGETGKDAVGFGHGGSFLGGRGTASGGLKPFLKKGFRNSKKP